MKTEELLKNISSLLKKHEIFLNSNPEIFYAIEERLIKAVDDEQDDSDNEQEDIFDKPEDTDQEDPDKEYLDTEAQDEIDDAPKASNARDWKPRSEPYSSEQQQAIDSAMKEGYTHREAERMANAHKAPSDYYSALKWGTNPSEPSSKFLEMLKPMAGKQVAKGEILKQDTAEQDINPTVHATGKVRAAREAVHGDYQTEREKHTSSPEFKKLSPREAHKSVKEWEKNYHSENPDYKEKAIAVADTSSKIHNESAEAAQKRQQEEREAVLGGSSDGDGVVGEYSQAAAGSDEGPMSSQAASQSLGAEGDEDSDFTSGVVTDPYAKFAQQNPEYHKKLQEEAGQKAEQEKQQLLSDPKLPSQISPERKAQFTPEQKAKFDAHVAKLAPDQQSRLASLPNRMPTTIKGPQ
ncbi:hypothetical protein UFOVP53_58 [uncultured Caudovirales phage]|uniref:Uncharacterized protein n=1 Tax=uncultured Caudovirales phage TaxID=2100421 RepID=A0A6J5KVT1_9CAUD|nr:hypothetical protein UFOVP53_58 [uncultured Caudovirales phage]